MRPVLPALSGGRMLPEPPSPAGGEPRAAGAPRRSRLSRSFRQSQAGPAEPGPARSWRRNQAGPAEAPESPRSRRAADFRTPTRISQPRAAPPPGLDSPLQDADVQQDIIWDATSPSPRRPGKRGKKPAAGAVSISEIVSRIAPKHGRPRFAEPTLQQWIGDSAAIPCTPEIQAPRARRKPPRLDGVEDLLRLARRFDQNLIHDQNQNQNHDEEEELERFLTEEFLESSQDEGPLQSDASGPEPPSRPEPEPWTHPEPRSGPEPFLDDDLDLLFDGPTQKLSGSLSRAPSQNRPASPSQNRPASPSREVGRKPVRCGSGPAVSGPVRMEFEDDWDDDPLVLEMTQNPPGLLVPKLCSTQNPAGSAGASGRVGPPVGTGAEKENLRPRASLGPERAPGSGTVQPDRQLDDEQNRFLSSSGPQEPGRLAADPLDPTRTDPADLLDLDSLFSSEPAWDDPADDRLLCEVCDDLEKRAPTQVRSDRAEPRPPLRPARGTAQNRVGPDPAGRSAAGAAAGQVKRPIRFQRPSSSGTGSEPPAAPPPAHSQRFTFRRPGNPVTTATGTAAGKCSAAEIELKKQQALERRRRRLEAASRPGDA